MLLFHELNVVVQARPVVVDFRISRKPVDFGGLTYYFSLRRRERRGDMCFLQRQYRFIPLRSLRLCEIKPCLLQLRKSIGARAGWRILASSNHRLDQVFPVYPASDNGAGDVYEDKKQSQVGEELVNFFPHFFLFIFVFFVLMIIVRTGISNQAKIGS